MILKLTQLLGKNSKEAFLKKVQLCAKTFDYKDETKDVKGKVRLHQCLLEYRLSGLMQLVNYNRCLGIRRM